MEKSSYIVVDSNIWVALYNANDALHKKSKKLMEMIDSSEMKTVVTDYITQEVFTVLSKRCGQSAGIQFYESIYNNDAVEIIDLNSYFFKKIIQFIKDTKLTQSIGFIDYSVIFFSDFISCPLASFDEQLVKAAKKIGVKIL